MTKELIKIKNETISNYEISNGKKIHVPIMGKIKIGEKKVNSNGREYPVALDYFRATGKYEHKFHEAYGQKPNKITIIFPSNDVNEVCLETFQLRDTAGRLLAEGDGVTWRAYNFDLKKYENDVEANNTQIVNKYLAKIKNIDEQFKRILTLRFMLLGIKGVGIGWQFQTKGKESSIPTIKGVYLAMLDSIGDIRNVPFDLVVEKVKSQAPDDPRIYPVVTLIPNLSVENRSILAEFIESGNVVNRIVTDDTIAQLVNNSTKMLNSANDIINEVVPEVIIEKPKSLATKEPNNDFIGSSDRAILKVQMKTHGFNEEQMKILLDYKGIESFEKFPKIMYNDFLSAVTDGRAMSKVKELEEEAKK